MARPERFELPTFWFVGVTGNYRYLVIQQVRWPALTVPAVQIRQEPSIAVESLRFPLS